MTESLTPEKLADLKALLHCDRCNDDGGVLGSYSEHDAGCDGSCRNCPVEVQYQEPCPKCGDGEAQAPISIAQVKSLVLALEQAWQERDRLKREQDAEIKSAFEWALDCDLYNGNESRFYGPAELLVQYRAEREKRT